MGLLGNAPEILANVNPSINTAMNNGYDFAQKAQQDRQAQKTYQRQQDFMNALGEEVQKVDYSKPEGQQALVKALGAKGFGPEAFALSKEFPKPAPNSFDFMDTPGGFAAGNKQTGQMTINPDIPSEKKDSKQAEDKFGAMKANLDNIMTPPAKGWNPLTGEKANALSKAIKYMPPDVLKSKVAQDWIANNKAEQQNTVFNPAQGGYVDAKMRLGTMQDWKPVRADYEKQSKAYVQSEGIVNSARFGKDQIGDVSLLNQLAQAETGSKPTDAEYRQMENSPGPMGKIAQAYAKVRDNKLLTPDVVKSIMAEFRSQQQIRHEGYLASIKEKQDEAKLNGVDPGLIAPGGIFQQVEKLKSRWQPEQGAAPVKVTSKADFDKLPSGTTYVGPSGHTAVKP